MKRIAKTAKYAVKAILKLHVANLRVRKFAGTEEGKKELNEYDKWSAVICALF